MRRLHGSEWLRNNNAPNKKNIWTLLPKSRMITILDIFHSIQSFNSILAGLAGGIVGSRNKVLAAEPLIGVKGEPLIDN